MRKKDKTPEEKYGIEELKKLLESLPDERKDSIMYQAFNKACSDEKSKKKSVSEVDYLGEALEWAIANDAVLVSSRAWYKMNFYGASALLKNRKLISYFAFLIEDDLNKFLNKSSFLDYYAIDIKEIEWNNRKVKFYDLV